MLRGFLMQVEVLVFFITYGIDSLYYLSLLRKEHKALSEIRKESEEKMLKNMSPRERMRLRKQKKADEGAKRMK